MRTSRPFRAHLLIGGLAAIGVVASHYLAYALAEPDAHLREELLQSNGHRYWWAMVALAFGLVSAGLARFAADSRNRTSPLDAGRLIRFSAPRLVAFQVLGFLALEGSERFLAHTSMWSLLGEPVVLIGVCIQALVAVVGALKFCVIGKAVASRGRPCVEHPHPSSARAAESVAFVRSLVGLRRGWSLRGPPIRGTA